MNKISIRNLDMNQYFNFSLKGHITVIFNP